MLQCRRRYRVYTNTYQAMNKLHEARILITVINNNLVFNYK